jgi:hypothetical protein
MRFTSSQIWFIVGSASLIWLALSVFGLTSGGGLSVVFTLADIIPALLFVGWIFEGWLWRWSPFHAVSLISTPVVIGTWRGELASFWVDPKTGQRPAIKTVYLTMAQTATTVSVRLLTDESVSEQLSGMITKADSGYPVISYNYRNTPDLKFRENNVSPIHYGGAVIEILGDPATGLKGWYWTDRETKGEFKFHEHCPDSAQSFAQAQGLTFGPPRPIGVLGRRLTRLLRRPSDQKPRP